jgi:uncharacterized protein YpmB
MKTFQKGSAAIWVILVIVLVVIGVGAYFIMNSKETCRITDSNGNTTVGPCPKTPAGTIVTTAQSDYDKVGQAMKDAAAKVRSTSPSGYLVPVAPIGYTLSPTSPSFTVDTASYLFTNSAGNTVYFMESPSLYTDAVNQIKGDHEYQLLDTMVSYNGGEATVYYHHTTINGKPASSMYLIYNHNGHIVSIQTNSSSMSAKDLENILTTTTVAK